MVSYGKIVCLLFLLGLFVGSHPVGAAEESPAVKAATELLDVMNMGEKHKQIIDALVKMQAKQNPVLEPYENTMRAFFEKHMGWERMKKDMVRIFTEKFTVEEIKALTAFYKTPLGKKAARLIPIISAQVSAMSQRRVQQHMGELQRMIAEEEARRR